LKSLLAFVVAILMVFTVFLVITPAVADPNENANDKAKDHAKFQVPENKKEIAPGIFSLGKYQVDGVVIEGIMAYHHNKGSHQNGGPPGKGNGDDDPPAPTNTCFSFLADGLKWKKAERWLVNPSNIRELDESQIELILSNSITKWENEAGKNILGKGTVTYDTLSADTAFPTDGLNEVYFADISDEGVIGVTIIWTQTSSFLPVRSQIFEWDQIYDDVSFDWTFDPSQAGEAVKMDFENIATHELGHSVGMGHPVIQDNDNDQVPDDDDPCIPETMYAFADFGETNKRDLHDGDKFGVQQLY